MLRMQKSYPRDTILCIQKPLYGLAESGLYWFKTYHAHHRNALQMSQSTYDPCLLFTANGASSFGITGLQTDDTFSFASPKFSTLGERELQNAKFRVKPKTVLTNNQPIEFNGGRFVLKGDEIIFIQKGQADNLLAIDRSAADVSQQYVAQRARGAYIASICQPEATYDLSIAAQTREPNEKENQQAVLSFLHPL